MENKPKEAKSQNTDIANVGTSLAIEPSKVTGKVFGQFQPASKTAKITDHYDFTVSIQVSMRLGCDTDGKLVEIKDLRYVKSYNPSAPKRIE